MMAPLRLMVGIAFGLASVEALASEQIYIQVGQAKTRKAELAIADVVLSPETKNPSAKNAAKLIDETVSNDLAFLDIFRFIPRKDFSEFGNIGVRPGSFKYSEWKGIGTEFLIKMEVSGTAQQLVLEGHLYDVVGQKPIMGKRFVSPSADAKLLAHTFANQVVYSLTGRKGIFLTKLAMVCDRTGNKELYVMDFDGSNARQITNHRSIVVSPAWSPNAEKIAYSIYTKNRKNIRNIDLFELDFSSNTVRVMSNRTGINSGASYSPDGAKIILTMSFLGNPEIFSLNPEKKEVTRLTKSLGFDVDPAFSPDGSRIAFVSSRSGLPMVYTSKADGTDPSRLTYAGRYNATPNWSPMSDKIVFAGWVDGQFDLFLINPDGTKLERLTKGQGNNEDPFFSPDGSLIIFSSNRAGNSNVYVMNRDGSYVKRLTYGLGNCVGPKWSPVP